MLFFIMQITKRVGCIVWGSLTSSAPLHYFPSNDSYLMKIPAVLILETKGFNLNSAGTTTRASSNSQLSYFGFYI
jgi:hypothetical protein